MKSPKRIGPRMVEAARIVAANPGCSMLPVARAIAPRGKHGSGKPGLQHGYRAVHRAIAAGLIKAERIGGRYSLTATK